MDELLKELSVADRVNFVMRQRGLTYESIIPAINVNMPDSVTPVKNRSEISRALYHGYSTGNRGKKNNAIISATLAALGI